MKVIGLTGGIATGKSTVSKKLELLGIPIIDCDLLARQVVEPGKPALKQIETKFGREYLKEDGSLNREKLGEFIFKNPAQRRQLNQITHWYIRIEIVKLILKYYVAAEPCVVIDAPLLIESGIHLFVGEMWVVYCDEKTQLERLIQRNQFSEEEATDRIKSQLSIETKKIMANRVIDNNGTLQETYAQVDRVVDEAVPSTVTTWAWIVLPPVIFIGFAYVFSKLLFKYLVFPVFNELIGYL